MTQADKKYQSLLQEWNACGTGLVDEPVDYYMNWWEISVMEAKQFGIDPKLNNALCLAYTRFQNMIGTTDSGIWEDEDAELDLENYKPYTNDNAGGEIQWNAVAAARFMSEVCKLPYQSCVGYIQFVENAMDRAGLISRTIHAYH